MKTYLLSLPAELLKQVKIESAKKEITMREYIERAIIAYKNMS